MFFQFQFLWARLLYLQWHKGNQVEDFRTDTPKNTVVSAKKKEGDEENTDLI